MKIQLQSLHVVNCGPLRDVCIQFNTNGNSPVTVLAGANGSGKTTILDCIANLSKLLDTGTYTEPSMPLAALESENPKFVIRPLKFLAKSERIISNWLVDTKPFCLFYGPRPSENELTSDMYGIVMRNQGQSDTQMRGDLARLINIVAGIQENYRVDTLPKQGVELASGENFGLLPSILYFPYDRSLAPVSGQQLQREETQYHWVYRYENVRSFAGSLDSYLLWLEYAEPEVYAQVIDFLNSLDFDGKKFGVERKELRAVVTTRDGQTHGVSELSSGEQNILIMLLELRRRLLPYSIVLIDEIENSLHAAFQHRLAQGLKKLQEMVPFQLIVTTHSSLFGRVFGPESVRILTEF